METIKVETYLKRVRCPNTKCEGTLEVDGKERTENGIHGGRAEYRHKCTHCPLSAFMFQKYPSVEYRQVPIAAAKLEIKKNEETVEGNPVGHGGDVVRPSKRRGADRPAAEMLYPGVFRIRREIAGFVYPPRRSELPFEGCSPRALLFFW